MSAPDWTEPFSAPDMFSAPKRGQGEPSAAVMLMGRLAYRGITLTLDGFKLSATPADALTPEDMAAIREHRADLVAILTPEQERPRLSLDEQTEAEAALALQTIGREPTPKETEQAKIEAKALAALIRTKFCPLSDEETQAAFFRKMESMLFNAGVLSIIWRLTPDKAALREFIEELRFVEDRMGREFQTALHRAQFREAEERFVLEQVQHTVASKARSLNSPRLEKAAALMAEMLAPDKLRPEAPKEVARKESSRKANDARREREREIWAKVDAETARHIKQGRSKNDAAKRTAPLAWGWNEEAATQDGRRPFSWSDEAQAFRAIRKRLAGE